jgi:dipeptide/tripeptide permease
MRLTWKDGLASLFVGAAVVLYSLWLTETAVPDMSTRALALVVFGLGWAACTSNQAQMAIVYGVHGRRPPTAYVMAASVIGAAALFAGIITLVTANEAMLATLVAAMIALWAMSTIRHAITRNTEADIHPLREPTDKAA